jgi:hypothetical protein
MRSGASGVTFYFGIIRSVNYSMAHAFSAPWAQSERVTTVFGGFATTAGRNPCAVGDTLAVFFTPYLGMKSAVNVPRGLFVIFNPARKPTFFAVV